MAAEKAPAFQFYPKDFLADSNVVAMNMAQRGAYITLLCWCWIDGSIPASVPALARVCRVPPAVFAHVWPALEPCFTAAPNGRLIQGRIERERKKQEQWRAMKAEAGQKGGLAKASRATKVLQQTPSRRLAKASPPSSSSSSVSDLQPSEEKKQASPVEPAKKPPDSRVVEFLTWFQSEYRLRRHGADYLVKWDKDAPLVKQMLGGTDLERLKKYAQILLSDKTDDDFIVTTDRGIGILSVRFNWLSDRLAAWEARQKMASA